MANETVDLRKFRRPEEERKLLEKPIKNNFFPVPKKKIAAYEFPFLKNRNHSSQQTASNITPVIFEWKTLEYEKTKKGPYWFITVSIAAAIFIIVGILSKSYFFAIFIALALIVLIMYIRRGPAEITFSITAKGIRVGKKIYTFQEIQSFWIFDEEEGTELSLETNQLLIHYIHLPLGNQDPEKLREVLRRFIPEKEHAESITDQIAKSIGL